MYCKYCGKPVDEGTMRCRICGRPVGPLEGGNGFWDLTEEKKAPADAGTGGADTVAPAPANDAEVKKLQSEMAELRKKLENRPAQRKSPLPALAALLGLLALALCVFLLFQIRALSGRVQTLELEMAERNATIAYEEQQAAANPQEAAPAEQTPAEPVQGESKWKGLYELEGIPLQPALNLFEGPNKGDNDERGQSINLGEPADGSETTTIFTARFVGPPGTYQYCWVRLETDESSDLTYFTPIREDNEEGYAIFRPNPSDRDKTYKLFIQGAVTKEHLGRYAFVVVDLQTRSAYVSQIVELYDRSEQAVSSQGQGDQAEGAVGSSDSSGNDTVGEDNGD